MNTYNITLLCRTLEFRYFTVEAASEEAAYATIAGDEKAGRILDQQEECDETLSQEECDETLSEDTVDFECHRILGCLPNEELCDQLEAARRAAGLSHQDVARLDPFGREFTQIFGRLGLTRDERRAAARWAARAGEGA